MHCAHVLMAVHVLSSPHRFSHLEFVVKEVTRLIHSEPVNFINIPEAAQVMSGFVSLWVWM